MTDSTSLYCTFRSAGHWFGAPIEDVKEVTTETACTRIPHAPPEVAGYVNMRGHIFLALDLRRLLGFDVSRSSDNRLVLFKPTVGPSFGILVDEIGDIASVAADEIEEFSAAAAPLAAGEPIRRVDLIDKVCRCPAELLLILQPKKFLRVVEQAMASTS
ncbi:MAG: chemotaxis protein CheW [Planctomycetia bacterium]|nr:chemotaxis protein CheW [Planctomycetia bacterium]